MRMRCCMLHFKRFGNNVQWLGGEENTANNIIVHWVMFLLVSFLTRSYTDSCSCDAVCYTSNDLEIVSQFSAQVARPRVSRIFARTTTFALTQASIYFSFAGHVVDHGSPIEGFAPWQVRYHRALLLHQAVPAVREGPRLSHFKLSGPFFCHFEQKMGPQKWGGPSKLQNWP